MSTLASENVWDRLPDCPVCHGDPESVEEPVYGTNAREATRPVDCPRCHTRNPLAHQGVLS